MKFYCREHGVRYHIAYCPQCIGEVATYLQRIRDTTSAGTAAHLASQRALRVLEKLEKNSHAHSTGAA